MCYTTNRSAGFIPLLDIPNYYHRKHPAAYHDILSTLRHEIKSPPFAGTGLPLLEYQGPRLQAKKSFVFPPHPNKASRG